MTETAALKKLCLIASYLVECCAAIIIEHLVCCCKKMNKGHFVKNCPYLSCSEANSAPLVRVYPCCVGLGSTA